MINGFRNKNLSQFYNDLSTFVHSGLTLERGLSFMKQGKKGSFFYMMDGLQFYIGQGGSLWEGMANWRSFFDDFQVMTIKAGEESGHLLEACKSLSRYYDMRHKEKKRLIGGLIYPVVLLHAVVLLPPLKYLVIESLETSYWSVVLPPLLTVYAILGLLVFSWNTYFKSGKPRESIDTFLLSLPWVGKLVKGMSLARVFRALASMSGAGIDPYRATQRAIQTAGNKAVALKLTGALEILENGGTFTNFFKFSGILEPGQMGAVAVGEDTGTLPGSLEKMVLQMEEENSRKLTQTVKAVGVIAYIIAVIATTLTVLSFYSDYFNIPDI